MTSGVRGWPHDLPHRGRAGAVLADPAIGLLADPAIGLLLEAGPELAGDGRPHPHAGPKKSAMITRITPIPYG